MICSDVYKCINSILITNDYVCSSKQNCVRFCDELYAAVCEENKKKYVLENFKVKADRLTILSMQVDGGVVVPDKSTPESICKCDYLFVVKSQNNPVAVLIELKGKNIKHAIEQIENSLIILKDALQGCIRVHGRIVYSGGTPKITNNPDFIRLQRKLKKMGGNLISSTNYYKESVLEIL